VIRKAKKKNYDYNSPSYKTWRLKVYKRDRYKCQLCGRMGNVNAHHIKRKIDFPDLTYRLDNGITLCTQCHYTITGKEKIVESLFRRIVNKTLSTKDILNMYIVAKKESLLLYSYLNKHKELITSMLIKLIKRQEVLK